MLFNSLEYLIFLPIVFILYWTLKGNLRTQNLFLLICSYFFYGVWDYRFLSLIIISSFVDFTVGLQISKSPSKRIKNLYLIISLLVNIGFLFVFKYYNFFIDSFAELVTIFGFRSNLSTLNILLPVGISFYTFQTLSYTIDIYRGKLNPTQSIIDFFAYVAFFPQLVAGPIERASNLLPQFAKSREFDFHKAKDGMRQILWGLFKKVVIADNCAVFVNAIFDSYELHSGFILVIGAILFAFQIYCDFSGYSDIAIGTARLLGFNLMQNFAMPYFSRDIAEFWRRWHISLSTWFRDYVYIPLGGSRGGKVMQLRNVFAIFLVSGFWHGANWTFIVWGFIHSMLYIPQVFFETNRKHAGQIAANRIFPGLLDFFKISITFCFVTLAWIFFRSDTIYDSFSYLHNLFNFTAHSQSLSVQLQNLGLELFNLQMNTFFIMILLTIEWFNRDSQHGLSILPNNIFIRYILYICLCLLILEYFFGESSFIYFQF